MRSTLFITTPLWHIAPALPAERPAWNTRSCLRCSACCCCRCRFCHRWRLLVIRDSDFGRERGIPEGRPINRRTRARNINFRGGLC
ncbi:uncharacterized protein [Anoplolepis gracilipes]|uniref:uncharacterized protein isoform X3 n=1 Tax=Anoplolepis gracilipes TaxID=354296 RepID=UPI003B9F52B2